LIIYSLFCTQWQMQSILSFPIPHSFISSILWFLSINFPHFPRLFVWNLADLPPL
jgi:hypothetical protein